MLLILASKKEKSLRNTNRMLDKALRVLTLFYPQAIQVGLPAISNLAKVVWELANYRGEKCSLGFDFPHLKFGGKPRRWCIINNFEVLFTLNPTKLLYYMMERKKWVTGSAPR
jgi:hypothetical protein